MDPFGQTILAWRLLLQDFDPDKYSSSGVVIENRAPFMIGTENWFDGISQTLLSASTKDLWALGIGFSLFFCRCCDCRRNVLIHGIQWDNERISGHFGAVLVIGDDGYGLWVHPMVVKRDRMWVVFWSDMGLWVKNRITDLVFVGWGWWCGGQFDVFGWGWWSIWCDWVRAHFNQTIGEKERSCGGRSGAMNGETIQLEMVMNDVFIARAFQLFCISLQYILWSN